MVFPKGGGRAEGLLQNLANHQLVEGKLRICKISPLTQERSKYSLQLLLSRTSYYCHCLAQSSRSEQSICRCREWNHSKASAFNLTRCVVTIAAKELIIRASTTYGILLLHWFPNSWPLGWKDPSLLSAQDTPSAT